MSSGEWLFVHFTHVEEDLRARQGPYLYAWGQKDRSTFLCLENALGILSQFLLSKPPPADLNALSGQTVLVVVNNALVRGRLLETTPSPRGLVQVFCIDSGSVQLVPQAFIRTLDVASVSPEAMLVAQCQPLAQKYMLADIVTPHELWPDHVIHYAKAVLENKSWKAHTLGNHGGAIEVRLYDNQNFPLAQTMIQCGMGIPAPNKVPTAETSGVSFPANYFARPVLETNSSAQVAAQTLAARIEQFPQMKHYLPSIASLGNQLQLPTPSAHVASTRSTSPQLINHAAVRHQLYVAPTAPIAHSSTVGQTSSGRSYIASEMKLGRPYEVMVTYIEDGVRKFSVQLKEAESELKELRRKLDSVPLRTMTNPSRARPCLALFSQDQLLHRGLVTACQEDKCNIYYVDYGNVELRDSRYIFEIPDDLVDIKLLSCRVSLADSEDLDHLDGVAEAFASIATGKIFKLEVVDVDRPQKVFLYDESGRNVKDVIISALGKGSLLAKKSFSPSQHLVSSVRAPPRREQVLNGQLVPSTSRVSVQIARQSILTEEKLFVTIVLSVGRFFGQLERLSIDDLHQIQVELAKVYGSLNDPPLLYADVNSHVGDFAVIKWSEDDQYYRVKIKEEFVIECEVCFVDYGNILKVSKREVLAPVGALSLFAKPAFGIYCQLPTSVVLSPERFEALMVDQPVHVNVTEFKNDVYFVTLTNDPTNDRLAALNISASSNQTAPQVRAPASNPSSFVSPPVAKGYAATVLSNLIHTETPPAVRAQTYTSWDTPPVGKGPVAALSGRTHVDTPPEVRAQTFTSWDTPPVGKGPVAAVISAHTNVDTPPEVRAQTFTSWDTPPSQLAWDTPPTTSRQSWETPSAPVKTPAPAPWDTPPSNSKSDSPNETGQVNGNAKKAAWNGQDGQNGDWRRPGSRFGGAALQPVDEEKKLDDSWNSSSSQSKRVSWGKTESAAPDRNWRSGSSRMAASRPEDERPPRLKLNLQPRMEKEANSLAPRALSPTPLAYPPQPVLANVTKGVEVVYVDNPMDFYCQLTEAIDPLDTMMAQLSQEYADASKPSVLNAKTGTPCVAQYIEDNSWYRGKILKIDNQEAEVLFVDYGNKQKSPLGDLKAIEKTFLTLPPQAYHCCLTAIKARDEWTPEDKTKFEDESMSKQLSATFTQRAAGGKYRVRLTHSEDGGNVQVLNELYGAPSTVDVPQPKDGCVPFELPSTAVDVTAAWFYHSCRFYLALSNTDDYQSNLDHLEEFYSSLGPDELKETEPSVGLLCVARYAEDQRFYRSQIIEIIGDVAQVLFVDYGNEQDDTPLQDLKRIVPEFLTIPKLTIPCQIKDVKRVEPPRSDYQTYEAACFVSGGDITALFHPAESNGYHPVDLVAKKVGNVKDYLIAKGVVESLDAEVVAPTEDVASTEVSSNYIPGKEFVSEALIPFMNSAREFWLQLNPGAVDALMTQIDEVSAQGELAVPSPVEVGSFCLAQYPDDGRWYRATVTSIVDSDATVYYVDYGNSCNVKVDELREILPAVAEIPHQAVKCSLYGIEHAEESVEDAFATEYETLIVSAKFVKMVDDRLCVRLFDANDGSDVNRKLGIPLVEEVYISYSESPSLFWVQLNSNSDAISEIHDQLNSEVGEVESPALDVIYAVKNPEDEAYYRAKLTSIGTDHAVAHFIDYGDSASVPLSDIHTCPESVRDTPHMAMKCGLKLNVPDDYHWTPGFVGLVKALAEEGKILEAVFCGEVDGVQLIRSLKAEEHNFVETIEEAIQNSASKRQEAEVDPLSDAVDQEIEPVSEGLEPSAENEQLVDEPNEETGADTDAGDVITEHVPEVNVTLHSDAAEGTEIVSAVGAAEPEEHSSFDHSIGTDSGLAESAGNDYSEGTSRRNSVAEKIAIMESLINARSNSPTSPIPDVVVSSRVPNVTATSVDSAKKCEPIASTEPEKIVDTCEVLEEVQTVVEFSYEPEVENLVEVVPTTATHHEVVEHIEEESCVTETFGDFHPQSVPVESHVSVYQCHEMEGIPTEEIEPCCDVVMQEHIPNFVEEERISEINVCTTEERLPYFEEIKNPAAAIMQEEVAVNPEEEPVLIVEPDTSEDFETSSGTGQVVGSFETEDNQQEEVCDETTATEENTDVDCAGDSLSSELTEKIDHEQPESDEPPIGTESESVLEDNSHCLDQLEVSPIEEIDDIPCIPVNGHDASGDGSVTHAKSYEGAKDCPLPYDASYDEEDKSITAEVPMSVPVLETATKAIADKLPTAITSFSRDQILSKNCSLSYSNGPDDFWLQWDPAVVTALMSDIDEFATKEEFAKLPAFQGTVGNACLACYKESETEPGMWHRAVVSTIIGDVGTVTYVDFGNSCPIKMSELKHLPAHLALLPPLACRCTLDGIDSTENDLTEAFVELFWMSTSVTAQFKKMKAGKLSVRLFRTSDNVDLNTKLGLISS